MARYIDLEELARRINKYVKPTNQDEKELVQWCIDECIRQGYCMPTADVVPRAEVARKIIGDVANAIWEGEPDSLNISVGKRYYNKKEFIAELKKKYTEGSDEG